MPRIKPTRKAKEKDNGFYKLHTGCGKLAITVKDDEDEHYPIRVIIEPIDGGCQGLIEYLRRSLTYMLECNLDIELYIDNVLEKIVCPSGKSRKIREKDKDVYVSCAKAVAYALKDHLTRLREKYEPKE